MVEQTEELPPRREGAAAQLGYHGAGIPLAPASGAGGNADHHGALVVVGTGLGGGDQTLALIDAIPERPFFQIGQHTLALFAAAAAVRRVGFEFLNFLQKIQELLHIFRAHSAGCDARRQRAGGRRGVATAHVGGFQRLGRKEGGQRRNAFQLAADTAHHLLPPKEGAHGPGVIAGIRAVNHKIIKKTQHQRIPARFTGERINAHGAVPDVKIVEVAVKEKVHFRLGGNIGLNGRAVGFFQLDHRNDIFFVEVMLSCGSCAAWRRVFPSGSCGAAGGCAQTEWDCRWEGCAPPPQGWGRS